MLQKEEESATLSLGSSSGTTHSVDVIFRIIGRVELDDPVNHREIETSLCNVCAEQDACFCLTELEVSSGSLLLLLLSMNVFNRDINVVQEI